MGYFAKLTQLNRANAADYLPLRVDGLPCGYVTPARGDLLAGYGASGCGIAVTALGVEVATGTQTAGERSAAMAELCARLRADGHVPSAFGEDFAVRARYSDPEHFRCDRRAMVFFGFLSVGVHMNGVVTRPDGPHLWIATRATDRGVEPGKRDNMVAGGQPAGIGLLENLHKEGMEEASLPPEMMAHVRAVGQTSYCFDDGDGIRRDVLFLYDIEVPEGFTPVNTDGEVARFDLLPAQEVLALVRETASVKFNVNAVLIDFGIRHGLITAETEADYEALCRGLGAAPHPGGLSALVARDRPGP